MAVTGLPLVQAAGTAARTTGSIVDATRRLLGESLSETPAKGLELQRLSSRPRLRDIVGRYDLERISPRDFSNLARQLRDAGLISDEEFQQLAAIRVDLELAGVDPDERIDLLDFFRERLTELKQQQAAVEADPDSKRAANPELERLQRHLGWLHQLAAAQSGPALDTVV